MNVQLFIPCFVDQLFPQTAFNMVKVLEKAGCKVSYNTNQTCCGQPAFNAGFCDEARVVATKFINDFESVDYVVAPSASCVGFIRNYYPTLFEKNIDQNKIQSLGKRTFEFSEFLINILKVENFGASFKGKITYHDSCAGLRECKIKEGPRRLLKNVEGLELIEMNDVETCCGFGGTFSVKFEGISVAMGEQKITNILATGADAVVTTDCSCLMQMSGIMKQKKLNIQTLHIADILATGW